VPLFAVGGQAVGAGLAGWMARRFFRGDPNDLIVTLASSTPQHLRPNAVTSSDHFGYFTKEEVSKRHTLEAVDFCHRALRPEAVADRHALKRRTAVEPTHARRRTGAKRVGVGLIPDGI
jgi:hypothetical protein